MVAFLFSKIGSLSVVQEDDGDDGRFVECLASAVSHTNSVDIRNANKHRATEHTWLTRLDRISTFGPVGS